MTPIEVGVNPKRALQRRSQHAEEFLQKYGFVRGQHFQDEQQALKLATQVQIELEIRSLRGGEGFFDEHFNNLHLKCGRTPPAHRLRYER